MIDIDNCDKLYGFFDGSWQMGINNLGGRDRDRGASGWLGSPIPKTLDKGFPLRDKSSRRAYQQDGKESTTQEQVDFASIEMALLIGTHQGPNSNPKGGATLGWDNLMASLSARPNYQPSH